jgi:ketosteroid isomerase-like protein
MPTDDQARAILEKAHHEWSLGNLDGMLAQFTDDMKFWCNAGDPAGGPIEFQGKAAFRQSLEAVLRTTRSRSQLLSFTFDGEVARANVSIRMESLINGVVLIATYREIVRYEALSISRIEEYHDAARLTAFWKLHAEGATPTQAVWDVEPSRDALK